MYFLSFSPKYSLQYLIISIKVGSVLLTWAFIPKDFSLTRRNYNYTRTLLYSRRSLWILACTLHFQRKNPNAACPDGMADGAGSLLLHFIAAHWRRSFSISHLPPPPEAAELLGEGNVGEQSLPIPSPQCHGREGIPTRIRLRRTPGHGGGVPEVFMVLEDSWHPTGGCGIQPGSILVWILPASQQILVPKDKQPVCQATRIWGSKYPWIPTSCGPGEPLQCQVEISHCSACALGSKDTLSPFSWLWPALACANINLGFSLAQPGSSQGETPLVWIMWQEFLMVGLENAAFPRVRSRIGKSHSGFGLGRNLFSFGADGRGSMGTRELHLELFPLKTQGTHAGKWGSPCGIQAVPGWLLRDV